MKLTSIPEPDAGTILAQIRALTTGPGTGLALLANVSSVLYWSMQDINWVGFYLLADDSLTLGPFHGKPACISIAVGKGVCGTAAARRETVVVPDVHLFPGHIACDDASRSEIVVPIVRHGSLFGVLDVDSPIVNRFTESEQLLFERVVATISPCLERFPA